MITRRFFIKKILISTFMFFACNTKRHGRFAASVLAETPQGRVKSRPGADILLKPLSNAEIQVECRFDKQILDNLDVHPLKGTVLCAIEARDQAPYCVPLFKDGGFKGVKKEKERTLSCYRYTVDVIQALHLSGYQGVYYIHLACRQFRSNVMAVHMKGLK
jgi:hypothetical protein